MVLYFHYDSKFKSLDKVVNVNIHIFDIHIHFLCGYISKEKNCVVNTLVNVLRAIRWNLTPKYQGKSWNKLLPR